MATKKKAIKIARVKKVRVAKPSRIEIFLQMLSELYPSDTLAPGLVIAWLPDKNIFYVSAVRYEGGGMGDKQRLFSTTAPSINAGVNQLIDIWIDKNKATMLLKKSIVVKGDGKLDPKLY